MRRSNFWFIISALMNLWLFADSTLADDSNAEPDKRPRLVAQLGHSFGIGSVAFSPDGRRVLTVSGDTTQLWETATGKAIRRFEGTTSAGGLAGAYSPDSRFVLTGSWDNTVRRWEVANGQELEVRRLGGHTDWVNAAAFSPDARWVLTGGQDGTARLWEMATGKEIRRYEGHTRRVVAVAFSPDGHWVLTGSSDETARLWEAATGKEVRRLEGHNEEIGGVAYSPDGKQVLTGGGRTACTARLWDAQSGTELRAFAGHSDDVRSVAFSPDGRWVLTGSEDKTARLWAAATAKEVRRFNGHTGWVNAVAFSPDGKQVLTGSEDNTARLWEAATGKELRRFEGHAQRINAVAFSSDGRWVLTGNGDSMKRGDTTARLWDGATGKAVRRLEGHTSAVDAVAFSPDGRWVLTGSYDRTARLWEAATGREVRRLEGRNEEIAGVAFSPDGSLMLTCGDKTAQLWEAATGKEVRGFEVSSRGGFKDGAGPVAFSPDGRLVLTGKVGAAIMWDVRTGDVIRRLPGHRRSRNKVAFSPNGQWVLVQGEGNTARLWEAATGKDVCCFEGHAEAVYAVAFSPDSRWALTGSSDMTARLWDVATGKEVRRFEGHTDRVLAVAFSPNGHWVLTGSQDQTARLWEAATGKTLCQLVGFRDGTWAVVDPAGRFDAAQGGDVEGLHWVVGNEPIALKQLKERYYDPGLLAKYMGYNKEPLRQVAAFTDIKLFPEVIEFAAPVAKTTQLKLNLKNRGGGIGKVQVFVNGKEIRADARGPRPDVNARQSTLIVDLAGAPVIPGKANQITVVTWNAEGYLSSRGMVREWTPEGEADPNPPELYVIVCGVSEYAEPTLNLRFAAKDAEDMARALELAGKRLFGADKVHLNLLSTGANPKAHKPTKENLRKAFEFVRKARPTDVLVVYLAGHGIDLKQGGDEYCYLTADARGTDTTALADPAVLALWTVTSSELVDWIKQIPALKQVMLLDTCAAGAAAAKLMDHRDLSGDQVRALDRLKDRTGFHVLLGCAADRVSYEASQYSQGLLTYSLLQGMAGARLREGEYVDVSGLFQYAADEVPNLARGIGGVQKPLVMAPRGTSFDIGRLIEADRMAVPLAKPKPLILRPLLSNVEDGDDNLKLAILVRKRLADDSFITPRGSAATTVYVDADELAGAVRPAGTYTIDGKKVSVRLVLKQDGQTLNKVTVDGSTDDLPALAAKIAEAIGAGTKKPRGQ